MHLLSSSSRSQTLDNMDRWKSRGGKSQRGEEQKREDQRRERVRRKKMQVREKEGKLRNTRFFPLICGSGGSKSRLAKVAKAAGAEPSGQMRDEKLHAFVARSRLYYLQVKKLKHRTFGTLLEVELSKKVHAVVARSTFRCQNAQSTPFSEHFWKLRCRKSARCCGAKHMSKSKCYKHYMLRGSDHF